MSQPPPAMAKVVPFLKRAEEFDKSANPSTAEFNAFIAYYCRFAAANVGMASLGSVPGTQKAAATAFMGELLGRLETARAAVGIQEGQQEQDLALVKRHALTLFKRSDDADRAALASPQTAREFLAAAELIGVVIALGDTEARLPGMVKHAKARAIEIVKARKEGRQPAPPPGCEGSDESFLAGLDALDFAAAFPGVPGGVPAPGGGGGGASAAAAAAAFAPAAAAPPPAYAPPPARAAAGAAPAGGSASAYAAFGGKDAAEDDDIPMAVAVAPPPGGGAAAAGGYAMAAAAYAPAPAASAPAPAPAAELLGPAARAAAAAAAAAQRGSAPPPAAAGGASSSSSGGGSGGGGYGAPSNPYASHHAPAPAPSAPPTAGRAAAPQQQLHRGGSLAQGAPHPSAGPSLPKGVLSDAAELTRFALAALGAGDADLAAQHLRGALTVLGR